MDNRTGSNHQNNKNAIKEQIKMKTEQKIGNSNSNERRTNPEKGSI